MVDVNDDDDDEAALTASLVHNEETDDDTVTDTLENGINEEETREIGTDEQKSQQEQSLTPSPTLEGKELGLFYYDEVIKGKCLGHGTFADVYEVEQFKPDNDENFDEIRSEARRYYSSEHNKTKYAIKCLRVEFESPRLFRLAARDMEIEVSLLATLHHPHIIKLHATSASFRKASTCTSQEDANDFFLVEDRLSRTLNDAIDQWKRDKMRLPTAPVFRLRNGGNVKKEQLLAERVQVAHDVASALAYLHSKRIVYRDLKPCNVGFISEGPLGVETTKLYDFGLSRRLPPLDKKVENDVYVMTGKTGSLPFMAPEVFHKEPYNEKVDVYSFAILLWIMLALDLPYLDLAHDLQALSSKVILKGKRPPVPSKWAPRLQSLLKRSWSKDMDERPTMAQVCATLEDVLEAKPPAPTAKSTNKTTGTIGFAPQVTQNSLRRSKFL